MLLLRLAVGLAAILQGVGYLSDPARLNSVYWFLGLLSIALGAAIVAGFLTPVVAVVEAFCVFCQGLAWLPSSDVSLFDSRPSTLFAITITIAIALLGPGRFSLDSRMFGRREIIIPPAPRSFE